MQKTIPSRLFLLSVQTLKGGKQLTPTRHIQMSLTAELAGSHLLEMPEAASASAGDGRKGEGMPRELAGGEDGLPGCA